MCIRNSSRFSLGLTRIYIRAYRRNRLWTLFFPVAKKTEGFELVGIILSSIFWSIFGTNIGWFSGSVFALRKALANSDDPEKPKTISQKVFTILKQKVIDNFVSPGVQIIIGAIIAVIVAGIKTVEPNNNMLRASLITGAIIGYMGGVLTDKYLASANQSPALSSVSNTEKTIVEKPGRRFRTAVSFLVDGLLFILEGAAIGLIIGQVFDQSGSGMSLLTTYWFPFGEAFANSEGVRPGQIYVKDVYVNGQSVIENVIFVGLFAGLVGSAIDVIRLILSGLAKEIIEIWRLAR